MPLPTQPLPVRRDELTAAALAFARESGSNVRAVRWDQPISGAEYRAGVILVGEDVGDLCDRALVPGRCREVWWDIGRLFAHEVAHGVAPRSDNALEEAVAETIGRARCGRILSSLTGAPAPPPARHWDEAGLYRPQARWLARLACWLGMSSTDLAFRLKDGRGPSGRSAASRQRLLLGRVVEEGVTGARSLSNGQAEGLGAWIAASAGSVNVPGGAHIPPRSPVSAARRYLAASEEV